MRSYVGAFLMLAVGVVGCGDDDDGGETTTGSGATGGFGGNATGGFGGGSGGAGGDSGGAGGDGGAAGGAGGGGGSSFVAPTPFAVPLSAAGPDQLQSVTAASDDGDFLAAGFAAVDVDGARAVVVVKFSDAGPDAAFGSGGVATTGLVFQGGSDEIDIATQSDGKILVSATVAHLGGLAGDRDIAVTRLNTDGTTDATFGVNGVVVVNLNDAHDNGVDLLGRDGARSLAVDGDDNIFVHAYSRGLGLAMGGGPRTDTDWTVVKLSPLGVVDLTFGTAGQFRLDIQEANATARGIKALDDGSLLAGGYANTPDFGTTQAVLYKLTPAGALDPAFATNGVWHDAVLATQTEIYNFAIHGSDVVTAGYGRNTGDNNVYVSLNFDLATGERDTTWGDAVNGAVLIDPSAGTLSNNARNAIGLPGGETVIIGSSGPGNDPAQDAVFAVLDENGKLDMSYGPGFHVFKLGTDGNDQFWGGAVSGTQVALVGYQGGGSAQTDTTNDDSYGVIFDIQ